MLIRERPASVESEGGEGGEKVWSKGFRRGRIRVGLRGSERPMDRSYARSPTGALGPHLLATLATLTALNNPPAFTRKARSPRSVNQPIVVSVHHAVALTTRCCFEL